MYNRYIPNEKGGFERVAVRSKAAAIVEQAPQARQTPQFLQPLKNLFPAQMDTGDILMILIFLLVLLDAEQDEMPSALLMLAAFIFG